MWSLPFNIDTMSEAGDFKFGILLGFSKSHHKRAHRAKGGRGLGLGKLPKIWGSLLIFLQWLKLAASKLAYSMLGFAKSYHKITHRRKVDVALG